MFRILVPACTSPATVVFGLRDDVHQTVPLAAVLVTSYLSLHLNNSETSRFFWKTLHFNFTLEQRELCDVTSLKC